MKIEKEMSSIMAGIFETELSEDNKQVAVYIADYVAKLVKKRLKCHVCNNTIVSNDNNVENDKYFKTLSRGGHIVPYTTFKDFVCQTFSIKLFSPIIEQVTEKNSVAAVSNTVLMKLDYGPTDFFCGQHFKKSKSMSLRKIINIFNNNKQKITNQDVREEQIRDFKKRQLKKR